MRVKLDRLPGTSCSKHVTAAALQHLVMCISLYVHVIPLSQHVNKYAMEIEFHLSWGTSCQMNVIDWWSSDMAVKFPGLAEGPEKRKIICGHILYWKDSPVVRVIEIYKVTNMGSVGRLNSAIYRIAILVTVKPILMFSILVQVTISHLLDFF